MSLRAEHQLQVRLSTSEEAMYFMQLVKLVTFNVIAEEAFARSLASE
jgi:hypothetical protein